MFVKETKAEILNIVKGQIEEIKNLKLDISSKEEFEMDGMNYGYEGEKKTILKPAQGNSTKLAIVAQTCLFQLFQQIDSFKEQVLVSQKKKDPPSVKEFTSLIIGFLNATKALKSREEYREIFGVKS